ncbi:MAG: methyltransferase [Ruminococcaceae bacterium]|nr:methyltransferase [Oscillospiraceae bacterium]
MLKFDRLWDGGPIYYYDTSLFPPTTDSFALGWFARPGRGGAVCDLGSGTGLLGTLLLARDDTLRLVSVEQNGDALALARRGFAENRWDTELLLGDLREPSALPVAGSMDYCVCNPPYFRSGSGKSANTEALRSAREEQGCTLPDVCAAAARVLRWGGRFALVYRPERLVDLLCALRAHGMEPKRLRFVSQHADAAPSLVLIEARRGGKPGLLTEPPLLVGSEEWAAVYFNKRQ